MRKYHGVVPFANYNKEFAARLVKAHVLGRKKFRFKNNTYETAKYVKGLVKDLKNKAYVLNVA